MEKVAIDVAGEFKAAPHHQRFLIVAILLLKIAGSAVY